MLKVVSNKKMQVKTIISYHFTCTRFTMEKSGNANCWKDENPYILLVQSPRKATLHSF